jgi:hypothetical protein
MFGLLGVSLINNHKISIMRKDERDKIIKLIADEISNQNYLMDDHGGEKEDFIESATKTATALVVKINFIIKSNQVNIEALEKARDAMSTNFLKGHNAYDEVVNALNLNKS